MANAAIPTADAITRLHAEAVERWHQGPIETLDQTSTDSSDSAFLALVSQQHECNFRLWHEEDKARSRAASDREIAEVKRTIDKLNQRRNDAVESLDDRLADLLDRAGVEASDDAELNTETPGSAIDRLSIMSLRIYHYREQLDRDDADAAHRRDVTKRIELCQQQMADLAESLQQLLDAIFSGTKRHQIYRQMKMYNDPSLNPLIGGDS